MWSFFRKKKEYDCPICAAKGELLDTVDLNKHCEVSKRGPLPRAGVGVQYYLCSDCRFCWAPMMHAWSVDEFEEKIYNQDYVYVDPEYVESRPRTNSEMLIANIPHASSIRHLDYGGGNGMLSKLLNQAGWQSSSYDPMVDHDVNIESLGKFDFITSFEVFEHVPDVHRLISDLGELIADDGIIIFSTITSDEFITPGKKLNWWYAAPRNGHISLFSQDALKRLGRSKNFQFTSFSPALHVFFKSVPDWASHMIKIV